MPGPPAPFVPTPLAEPKPPRSNRTNPSVAIAKKAAELFGVGVADILGERSAPPAREKPGPPTALEERVDQLRRPPRTPQDVVIRMIDGLLGAQPR